jgi:predicted lipid carrier protein YhbT
MALLDIGSVSTGVKRRFADVTTQAAEGVSRLVGDASEGQLEWVMRSPIRRVFLDAIFWQMPRQLDGRRADRVDATVRWCVTAAGGDTVDVYDLVIHEGECHVNRGATTAEPRVTITIEGAEFLRLVTGNSDALQAYFNRRLALSGDIMFAAKLISMFRVPKSRRA